LPSSGSLHAQTTPTPATCKSQATGKKLAGAALNSFMKKRETGAQSACDASSADKGLSGAAKTSFTKKSITDAVAADSTATGGGQRNNEAPGVARQRSTRSSATALRFSMLKRVA
jgi:hypothetical protein